MEQDNLKLGRADKIFIKEVVDNFETLRKSLNGDNKMKMMDTIEKLYLSYRVYKEAYERESKKQKKVSYNYEDELKNVQELNKIKEVNKTIRYNTKIKKIRQENK